MPNVLFKNPGHKLNHTKHMLYDELCYKFEFHILGNNVLILNYDIVTGDLVCIVLYLYSFSFIDATIKMHDNN